MFILYAHLYNMNSILNYQNYTQIHNEQLCLLTLCLHRIAKLKRQSLYASE